MQNIKQIFTIFTILFSFHIQAQEGLVAHWSFDSITNNQFMEHVSNQMGGTCYGCQSVDGPVGKALDFDGDDFARIPANGVVPPPVLSNLSEGSISVWFRIDDIPDYGIRPIFYYGNDRPCDFFDAANEGMIIEVGHSPIHNGSHRMYFTMWTNGCTLPTFCYDSHGVITEGEWYHFVAIVGSDFNTGYLNGKLMDNRNYNFGNSSTNFFFSDALAHDALWLGRGFWDGNNMFLDGAIDEIKIFDHPLNQKEVNTLYSEGNFTSIIEKKHEHADLYLYPNPSKNIVNIKIPFYIEESIELIIFSGNGTIVFKTRISEQSKTRAIDLSKLSNGIYSYSIINQTKAIKTGELILQ